MPTFGLLNQVLQLHISALAGVVTCKHQRPIMLLETTPTTAEKIKNPLSA